MSPTFTPRLIVRSDRDEAATEVADLVVSALRDRQVLGLATGATMAPLYRMLHQRRADLGLPRAGVFGIALDEYIGIGRDHPAGFAAYLRHAIIDPLGLAAEQIIVPDGAAPDRMAAAARHEAAIASAGGIGLQLLGLGQNGHIGFNEPGSALDSRTRDVTLAEDTRIAQAPEFGAIEAVPARAITAGVGTILAARRLVMLVTGEAKAAALSAALDGPIGPHCPASALRLHPDAVVVCDRAAAIRLQNGAASKKVS